MHESFWHDRSITIKHPAYYLPMWMARSALRFPGVNLSSIVPYRTQCFEAHIVEIQGYAQEDDDDEVVE